MLMKITIVIPTRNRPLHVEKLLYCLSLQTRLADEIIIVDSSEEKDYQVELSTKFYSLSLRWIDAPTSVCVQRNKGVKEASGDWVFLCDDDIEISPDYLEQLSNYVRNNPDCGALAGRLLQREGDQWVDRYSVKNFSSLIWRFIFQLSIWGNITEMKVPIILKPLHAALVKFYQWRGNHLTLAGWPLITQWNENVLKTSIYSLGANLIKREWLLASPYDEVLDPSGIGDNYGVARSFPGKFSIHVISTTCAYHHRAPENRLVAPLIHFRRILALHYFIKRKQKYSVLTTLFFIWSLIGTLILYAVRRNNAMYNVMAKSIIIILSGKNPYYAGFKNNLKIVTPVP
jgi:glycosyltransferase involved in cell wall biosynthesis